MYTIQIGSFVLNGQIILLMVFGWFGWIAMQRYIRKLSAEENYGTIALNAFIIWFLVWKGSPLLLDPLQTIKHPASLLYFDGGVLGQWIASMVSGLYVAYRTWKERLSWKFTAEIASCYLLGGMAFYHLGLIWFESDNWLFHAGYAVLSLVALYSLFVLKQPAPLKRIVQRWQWFSIGLVFIWYLYPEKELLILSFSSHQVFSLTMGIILSIFLWLYDVQKINGERGNH